ncbi:hypothetical protein MHTCC0001_35090 [Flavobacteriaceae bacterium MHTCC 0001]
MMCISRLVFLILSILFLNPVYGQDLTGKWLLKDIDFGKGKSYGGFQLIEIEGNIVNLFIDFSLSEKFQELKLKSKVLFTMNGSKYADYKVVDKNNLRLFVKGKHNDHKDIIIKYNFYRLLPTITILKKNEIEKLSFVLKDNNIESEIVFNEEFLDSETLKIIGLIEGRKMLIEQIDHTFFISVYYSGKRECSIPIKEVTTDFLKLYALPNELPENVTYIRK